MVGKFVFVFFPCVFLSQVQGNALDNAIKNGINKLKGLHQDGQKRIEAANKEVDGKVMLIESKTLNYILKFERISDKIQQTLQSRAQKFEEKAKAAEKPEPALKCIQENEETANDNSTILVDKLKDHMKHLEKVKLKNVKAGTQSLYEVQTAMMVRYERAVKVIENCEYPACVTMATRNCAIWLDHLFADIKRILGQITTVIKNFDRDATKYINNSTHQISMIQTNTLKNFKNCILTENDFIKKN